VRFVVERAALPTLIVDADEHRVEGASHVFRRDTLVMGRPRRVVALRLSLAEVLTVSRDGVARRR
jgi:hypothetical protein